MNYEVDINPLNGQSRSRFSIPSVFSNENLHFRKFPLNQKCSMFKVKLPVLVISKENLSNKRPLCNLMNEGDSPSFKGCQVLKKFKHSTIPNAFEPVPMLNFKPCEVDYTILDEETKAKKSTSCSSDSQIIPESEDFEQQTHITGKIHTSRKVSQRPKKIIVPKKKKSQPQRQSQTILKEEITKLVHQIQNSELHYKQQISRLERSLQEEKELREQAEARCKIETARLDSLLQDQERQLRELKHVDKVETEHIFRTGQEPESMNESEPYQSKNEELKGHIKKTIVEESKSQTRDCIRKAQALLLEEMILQLKKQLLNNEEELLGLLSTAKEDATSRFLFETGIPKEHPKNLSIKHSKQQIPCHQIEKKEKDIKTKQEAKEKENLKLFLVNPKQEEVIEIESSPPSPTLNQALEAKLRFLILADPKFKTEYQSVNDCGKLDSRIIDDYLKTLAPNYPDILFFDSIRFMTLNGYNGSAKLNPPKVNTRSLEKFKSILAPHWTQKKGGHWGLIYISLMNGTWENGEIKCFYSNSLTEVDETLVNDAINKLLMYLAQTLPSKKILNLPKSFERISSMRQENNIDCGVIMLLSALKILGKEPLEKDNQKDLIFNFRKQLYQKLMEPLA